jgi:hypothetical protein
MLPIAAAYEWHGHLSLWIDKFLHRFGRSPCGASASNMVENKNAPGNENLLLPVLLL